MMSTPEVNTDATGLVIRGYDPVAYFTEGRPVPGRSDLEVEYQGGKYLFVSPANRDVLKQILKNTYPNMVDIVLSGSPWERSLISIPDHGALLTGNSIST